jgi:aminopeptidase N
MRLNLFLLGFVFVAFLQTKGQESPLSVTDACGLNKQTALERRNETTAADVFYLDLQLHVNPQNAYLEGQAALHFKPFVASSTLQLSLHRSLTVDSVKRGELPLGFSRNLDRLVVQLGGVLSPNTTDSVRVYYSGFPSFENMYYSRSVHASGPIVATRSQPYGCMYWWPCQNTLSDKVDSLRISLICNKAFTGVANGVLVQETAIDSNLNLFVWKHNYPIASYLVAVSFSAYERIEEVVHFNHRIDSVRLQHFVYPFYKNTAEALVQVTKPMMQLFDSLFGPYPFAREQYGHAQFHHGGGMEHQTMSFMGTFSYDLIAHELAHQWFGNKVTCSTWEELWLNEGFATYGNLLCYQYLVSDSAWLRQIEATMDVVMSATNGSVFVKDTTGFPTLFDQRLVYKKGAMVLHMLRFVCGDEAFFRGVRAYLADTTFAYGFVKQRDLQFHLEQAAGVDLSLFFEQWILGEGHPLYTIAFAQAPSGQVEIEITQETTHPSVGFFELPIPLLLKGKQGQSQWLRLLPNSSAYKVTIEPGFELSQLVFDPQRNILARALVFDKSKDVQLPIVLFPNPVQGSFQVVLPSAELLAYRILSPTGAVVKEEKLRESLPSGQTYPIDMLNFSPGFYIFEAETNQGRVLRKYCKQF